MKNRMIPTPNLTPKLAVFPNAGSFAPFLIFISSAHIGNEVSALKIKYGSPINTVISLRIDDKTRLFFLNEYIDTPVFLRFASNS